MIRLKDLITEQTSKRQSKEPALQNVKFDYKTDVASFTYYGKKYVIDFGEYDVIDVIDDHGNEGRDVYYIAHDPDSLAKFSIDAYEDYNGENTKMDPDTIEMTDAARIQIFINSIDGSTNFNQVWLPFKPETLLTKDRVTDGIQELIADAESTNQTDDDGNPAYDQTRLESSEFKADCEILIQDGTTIDLKMIFDEDGNIEDMEIEDPQVAKQYGINDREIGYYLKRKHPGQGFDEVPGF